MLHLDVIYQILSHVDWKTLWFNIPLVCRTLKDVSRDLTLWNRVLSRYSVYGDINLNYNDQERHISKLKIEANNHNLCVPVDANLTEWSRMLYIKNNIKLILCRYAETSLFEKLTQSKTNNEHCFPSLLPWLERLSFC